MFPIRGNLTSRHVESCPKSRFLELLSLRLRGQFPLNPSASSPSSASSSTILQAQMLAEKSMPTSGYNFSRFPRKNPLRTSRKKNGSRFADGQQLLCFVMAYSMLRLCTQRMYLSTWVKVGLGETTPINSRNLESRGQATKLMAARQRHLGPGTIG